MTKEKETQNINPEQIKNFLGWCQKNKIARFLIDGDDTLWGTVEIFRGFQTDSYSYLHQETGVAEETWKKRIMALNDRFFEQFGVNPTRWEKVTSQLAKDFSLSAEIETETLKILMQIYNTPPVLLPGTEQGLTFLQQTGVPFSLVTHANAAWTKQKIDWLGLGRFFSPQDVHIIDENGHKTAQSWLGVINYYQLQPNQCVVIGDSPRSDINPVWELGVRQAFLLKRELSIWSIHERPISSEVAVISSLEALKELKA